MPQRDNSKRECFRLWKDGRSISEIQRATTATHESIRAWVREWERGLHRTWDVGLSKSRLPSRPAERLREDLTKIFQEEGQSQFINTLAERSM